MKRGGAATLRIQRVITIVGVAGIVACSGGPRTGPTADASGAAASAEHGAERGDSRVVVQTAPRTFVWLDPAFAHEFPPAEGAAYIDQQGQMFMPDTLLVRTGQAVHFRSSEDVLHNVRVTRSDKTPIFNVATPPWGSYTHTFDEAGFYNVTWDIHIAMRAAMYVASTPYARVDVRLP